MAKIFGNTTATPLMVEQKYNPASDKPQSGKAIAGVISGLLDRVKNVTFDEYYDVDGYEASYSEGVYKAKNGFVIQRVAGYSENSSYYGVEQYWYNGGEVYFRSLGDEGGWQNDWRKISVSQTDLDNKVDKVSDKGLSTEDFTTALKNKLETMPEGGSDITVDSELSTTSANPAQNKVITAELNKKANKELAFDDYISIEYDYDDVESLLNGEKFNIIKSTGIKKVIYSINGYPKQQGILLIGLERGEYDELYAMFYANDGTMWQTSSYEDHGIISDWEKVSVSQSDLDAKADANYVDELAVAIEDTYRLAEKKVDKEENKTLLEYVPIKDDYYVRWERLNDDIYARTGVSVAFASAQGNGVLEELSDVALVLRSNTDDEKITVITSDGEIYQTTYVYGYEDEGWNDWRKISVSQTDLDNAIGDVETSLENIIQKYGLNNENLLDEAIILADQYINEVSE